MCKYSRTPNSKLLFRYRLLDNKKEIELQQFDKKFYMNINKIDSTGYVLFSTRTEVSVSIEEDYYLGIVNDTMGIIMYYLYKETKIEPLYSDETVLCPLFTQDMIYNNPTHSIKELEHQKKYKKYIIRFGAEEKKIYIRKH